MDAPSFRALLDARHTVRDFDPRPIEPSVLDEILDDARHCPSWSNTRPYLLVVASGDEADELREAYLAEFDQSMALLRSGWRERARQLARRKGLPNGDFNTLRRPKDLDHRKRAVGKALYEHLGIARGDWTARDAHDRLNAAFFDAPTIVLVFAHEGLLPFSAHDAGLMSQTLVLSAAAHGVGSCFLGTLATWRRPVDERYVIDKHYKLVTGLALGYATDAPVNDFRAEHIAVPQAGRRR